MSNNDRDNLILEISRGNIDDVLDIIEYDVLDIDKQKHLQSEFYILKARYNRNEKAHRAGIISTSDYLIYRNKFKVNLIEFTAKLQATEANEIIINISIYYKDIDYVYVRTLKKEMNLNVNRRYSINFLDKGESMEEKDFSTIEKEINKSDIVMFVMDYIFDVFNEFEQRKIKKCVDDKYGISVLFLFSQKRLNMHKVFREKGLGRMLMGNSMYIYNRNTKSLFNIIDKIIYRKLQESNRKYQEISSLENKLKNIRIKENHIVELEMIHDYYKKNKNAEKSKYYLEELKKAKYNLNIKFPSKITIFQLKEVSIFDEIRWFLKPSVNLILGQNGYGKSHLLRLLPCLLQEEKKIMDVDYHLYDYSHLKLIIEQDGEDKEVFYNDCEFLASLGKIPLLAIPAVRNISKTNDFTPLKSNISASLAENCAFRFINKLPFDDLLGDRLFVFGNELIKEKKESNDKNYIYKNELVKLITNIICELNQSKFKISRVTEFIGESRVDIKVETEGNEREIKLQDVSQGTLSIISIILLIYHYLKSLRPEFSSNEILKSKALVFIDEIDAHLHPKWQQVIVGILRRTFPNVQFIMTAHSPLVVSGCLEGEVSVLRKDTKTGKFSLQQFGNHFIGKDIKSIYQEVFEMENVDDDETYLRYLTELSINSKELDKKITELENKSILSKEEDNKLHDLYRMVEVQEIKEQRTKEDKEEKIAELESQIRQLNFLLDQKESDQ